MTNKFINYNETKIFTKILIMNSAKKVRIFSFIFLSKIQTIKNICKKPKNEPILYQSFSSIIGEGCIKSDSVEVIK